jgi:hypothetical protein
MTFEVKYFIESGNYETLWVYIDHVWTFVQTFSSNLNNF